MAKKLDERKNDYFNALNRLEDALKKDLDDDIIIDGIIQRFEFTFEQAWKAAGFSSNTADVVRHTITCAVNHAHCPSTSAGIIVKDSIKVCNFSSDCHLKFIVYTHGSIL